MSFRVRISPEAEADLDRLFDYVLERELNRAGGNAKLAAGAIQAIRAGVAALATTPFTCRKAGATPFLRELIIAFGKTGYVALFEILDAKEVLVVAVRHQLEDDCH